MTVVFGVIGLVVLIVLAAYLAAAEGGLMRVNRIRVRYLAEKNVARADSLEKLVENPGRYIPPLLLAVMAVELSAASLATWLTTKVSGSAVIGVTAGTAVITFLMFLFSLICKSIASYSPERVSLWVARPVALITSILRYPAYIFEVAANGIVNILGKLGLPRERMVEEADEIITMMDAAHEDEVVAEEGREMMRSIVEFGNAVARQVMVPRPDMITISSDTTVTEALHAIVESGRSRIPVYEYDKDNIVGILYAKDLIESAEKGEREKRAGDLAREAYFTPEIINLTDLLGELQKRKTYMALAINEHGVVTGLVTIEDLMEAIVGDIFDEYDEERILIEKYSSTAYEADASVTITNLNSVLNLNLPNEGCDTLGGFVFKVSGKVPVAGEAFVYEGMKFVVEKVKNNRIAKVIIEPKGKDLAESRSGD